MGLPQFCAICLLSASLVVGAIAPAKAQQTFEIDQIMDMNALPPEGFHRFVPNYLWIKVGDTVRFINTTGNHTVKNVDGIWP